MRNHVGVREHHEYFNLNPIIIYVRIWFKYVFQSYQRNPSRLKSQGLKRIAWNICRSWSMCTVLKTVARVYYYSPERNKRNRPAAQRQPPRDRKIVTQWRNAPRIHNIIMLPCCCVQFSTWSFYGGIRNGIVFYFYFWNLIRTHVSKVMQVSECALVSLPICVV